MESLTKENYWNELQAKCPTAMKGFCDWIDEYKKKVGWKSIFTHRYKVHVTDTQENYPKFHDIPIAMQMGIILEYLIETATCMPDIKLFGEEINDTEDFADTLKEFFIATEKMINEEKQISN